MPRNYQIGGINYEDIKFDVREKDFFNFQFEAPQQWTDDEPHPFWLRIAHPVHVVQLEYPQLRRCVSQGKSILPQLRKMNMYRYFMKFVAEQKKCFERDSTIKK